MKETHGTRSSYQTGCRCADCRQANTAYWSAWRKAKLANRPPLGTLISAAEARRLILLMQRDWDSKMALDRELGLNRHLARLRERDRVRLRTVLKLRRFYRLRVVDPDTATGADESVASS